MRALLPQVTKARAGARHPGKVYGLVRRQGRQDVHRVYELVNANQADAKVATMCRVLGVSTSGYYAWCDRAPSLTTMNNAVLAERIRQVHADSHHTYGMPRVRAELIDQGLVLSRKRVARLMRTHGIRGISRRRDFTVTTLREKRQDNAPDLVRRQFDADAPNRLWVADMTYVPTWAGFIYPAVVLDAWSGVWWAGPSARR